MRVVGLRSVGRGEVDSHVSAPELGSRGKPFAPTVGRLALGFPKKGKAVAYSGTDREKLRDEGPSTQASSHFHYSF